MSTTAIPLEAPHRSRRRTAAIACVASLAVAGGVAGGVLATRDDGGATKRAPVVAPAAQSHSQPAAQNAPVRRLPSPR
jgi:hypothetical protein